MGANSDVESQLSVSIRAYRDALAEKTGEEKEDLLKVAGHADAVAKAFESGDVAAAKLSLSAYSRQVSDSYYSQPPEHKAVSAALMAVERQIFGAS